MLRWKANHWCILALADVVTSLIINIACTGIAYVKANLLYVSYYWHLKPDYSVMLVQLPTSPDFANSI